MHDAAVMAPKQETHPAPRADEPDLENEENEADPQGDQQENPQMAIRVLPDGIEGFERRRRRILRMLRRREAAVNQQMRILDGADAVFVYNPHPVNHYIPNIMGIHRKAPARPKRH